MAAVLGLVAFALVVIWFGILDRGVPTKTPPDAPAIADLGEAKPSPQPAPSSVKPGPEPRREAARGEPPNPRAAANVPSAPSAPSAPEKPNQSREGAVAPSFDVVRVEPSGESVIAGRTAPGATVEMLRNGAMHARVASDPSGLFAFVPQPMPPGTNEILLQSIAPDGTRMQSRESITVVISEKRDAKPLVTMTAPDKPTVVLSSPDEQVAAAEKPAAPEAPPKVAVLPEASVGAPPDAAPPSAPPAPPPSADPAVAAPRPPPAATAEPPPPAPKPRSQVRIASVEAEEGGRLFVSGRAAPGATVRLYLNESLVAPGGAGADGRISFAIGRGVRPGAYRVRLDDVDPVSGEVKSRAEVEFNVPAPLVVELPPPVQPYVTTPPVAAAGPPADAAPGAVVAGQAAGAGPAQDGGDQPARARTAAASPPATQGGAETSAGTRTAAAAPPTTQPAPRREAAGREFDPGTILVPEINTAIVSRGDNLWRISRRIYGRGVRYSVIYSANQQQIRNPGLIYPGQVFVLPTESAENAPR